MGGPGSRRTIGGPASQGPLPGNAGALTPLILKPPGGHRGAQSENPASPRSPPNRVREVLSRSHHGAVAAPERLGGIRRPACTGLPVVQGCEAPACRLDSRCKPMAPCPVSRSVAGRRQSAERPGSQGSAKSPVTEAALHAQQPARPVPPGLPRAGLGLGFRSPASRGPSRGGAAVGAELRRAVCVSPELACGGHVDGARSDRAYKRIRPVTSTPHSVAIL